MVPHRHSVAVTGGMKPCTQNWNPGKEGYQMAQMGSQWCEFVKLIDFTAVAF